MSFRMNKSFSFRSRKGSDEENINSTVNATAEVAAVSELERETLQKMSELVEKASTARSTQNSETETMSLCSPDERRKRNPNTAPDNLNPNNSTAPDTTPLLSKPSVASNSNSIITHNEDIDTPPSPDQSSQELQHDDLNHEEGTTTTTTTTHQQGVEAKGQEEQQALEEGNNNNKEGNNNNNKEGNNNNKENKSGELPTVNVSPASSFTASQQPRRRSVDSLEAPFTAGREKQSSFKEKSQRFSIRHMFSPKGKRKLGVRFRDNRDSFIAPKRWAKRGSNDIDAEPGERGVGEMSPQAVTLFVGTWNTCGHQINRSQIAEWLSLNAWSDLVVIGLENLPEEDNPTQVDIAIANKYSAPDDKDTNNRSFWSFFNNLTKKRENTVPHSVDRLFLEHLGADYSMVLVKQAQNLRVMFLARVALLPYFSLFSSFSYGKADESGKPIRSACGFGFKLTGTDIRLVCYNLDLPADSLSTCYNRHMHEMLSDISVQQNSGIDITQDADHTVLFGSGEYPAKIPSHLSLDEARSEVIGHIHNGHWEELRSFDALRSNIRMGNLLWGFREGVPNFAPTSPFILGKAAYEDKSLPQYNERIFFRSFPAQRHRLNQTNFSTSLSSACGRHKPVESVFDIDVEPQPIAEPRNVQTFKANLEVTSVQVRGLELITFKPTLQFMGRGLNPNPSKSLTKSTIAEAKEQSAATVNTDNTQTLGGCVVVFVGSVSMKLEVASLERLSREHLSVLVWSDSTRNQVLLAQGTIVLGHLLPDQFKPNQQIKSTHTFHIKLTHCGLVKGELDCDVSLNCLGARVMKNEPSGAGGLQVSDVVVKRQISTESHEVEGVFTLKDKMMGTQNVKQTETKPLKGVLKITSPVKHHNDE